MKGMRSRSTFWRQTSATLMPELASSTGATSWRSSSTAVMLWTASSTTAVPWVSKSSSVVWHKPYAASEAISKATSHDDIHNALEMHSGAVVDPKQATVLYSGTLEVVSKQDRSKRWTFSSESVTQLIAKATKANIVNDTERALMLVHPLVDMALSKKLIQLKVDSLRLQGKPLDKPIDLKALQALHLYGPTENSYWGRLSKQFNASAQDRMIIVATNASPDRVLAKIELPEALRNANVVTISGLDRLSLQKSLSSGAMTHSDMFALSQQPCIDAVKKGGLFVSPDGKLMLSKEFTDELGLKGARLPSSAELLDRGYMPLDTGRTTTLPKINPSILSALVPPGSAALVNTGASPALTTHAVVLSSPHAQGGSSPLVPPGSTADLLARVTQAVNDLQSGNRDSARTDIHTLANTDSSHQMQALAKAAASEPQTTPQRSGQTQAPPQQDSQNPPQSHPTTPTNSGNGTQHH